MLKPSGLERLARSVCARRRAASIVCSRSSSEIVHQVGGVRARHHQRVPARGRVDVHEGDRVLVGVEDLRRDVAGDDPAEQAVGGHRPGSLFAERLSARAAIASSAAGDLAGEHAGLDLAEQAAELRARLDAERRGKLVAAIGARGGPSRRQSRPSADHLAGELEVRLDHLLAGDRAAAPRREPVGDREQGDVDGVRVGRPQVLEDLRGG